VETVSILLLGLAIGCVITRGCRQGRKQRPNSGPTNFRLREVFGPLKPQFPICARSRVKREATLTQRVESLVACSNSSGSSVNKRLRRKQDSNTHELLWRIFAVRDQLSNEIQRRVAAETKLKETEANLEEQRKLLDEAIARLSDTFGSLSAEGAFETIKSQANRDIESRRKAIDGPVAPLKESLDKYEKQVIEMEKSRESAYGPLDEQLRTLAGTNQQLQRETGSLVTAALSTSPRKVGRDARSCTQLYPE
jgi:DNA anti-recombination protein RmuC